MVWPTSKATVSLWTNPPLVAVMVIVYMLVGVELAMLRVSVELPEAPVMEEGSKEYVAPGGRLVALRVTFPVKPLTGETVTLVKVLCPGSVPAGLLMGAI